MWHLRMGFEEHLTHSTAANVQLSFMAREFSPPRSNCAIKSIREFNEAIKSSFWTLFVRAADFVTFESISEVFAINQMRRVEKKEISNQAAASRREISLLRWTNNDVE